MAVKTGGISEATLLVLGTWNSIAEWTGTISERVKSDIAAEISKFRWPRWFEFFWIWGWYKAVYERIRAIAVTIADGIREWAGGVQIIVRDAAAGEIPMPQGLSSKVVRGDEAARYIIRELLSVADEVAISDSEKVQATILEVANVSAYDPSDPTYRLDPDQDIPTRAQRVWASIVAMSVNASIWFLPFAVAYVAGLWYLQLWGGRATLPSLSQDSKRVRIDKPSTRYRLNVRKGADKGK